MGLCGTYVGPMLGSWRWGNVEPTICSAKNSVVLLGNDQPKRNTPFLGHFEAMLGLCFPDIPWDLALAALAVEQGLTEYSDPGLAVRVRQGPRLQSKRGRDHSDPGLAVRVGPAGTTAIERLQLRSGGGGRRQEEEEEVGQLSTLT